MHILTVDFETQGDNALETRVTEVGACSLTLSVNESALMRVYNQLCWESDYPPQDPFIVELTGITDEMLKKDGVPRHLAFARLIPLVQGADVIFAHKKAFDQTVFESTCRALGIEVPTGKEWICTLSEFNWPAKYTCKKLSHLAFDHGLEFDRSKMHRAGDDAALLMRLIQLYGLEKVLVYARAPWVYIKADILPPWKDGGAQKEIAYKLGFSYERCKYTEAPVWSKTWVMRTKDAGLFEQMQVKVAASASPFRLSIIEGIN